MTNYESIKSKNIDELAEYLEECIEWDNSPWEKWFDKNYCQKCAIVKAFAPYIKRETEFAWCELNDGCRFFEGFDGIAIIEDCKNVIKLWLESEA